METLQESKHRAEVDNTTLKSEVAQLRMDQQNFLHNESEGARGVMVIVVGNGHCDTSSNPRRD